jgi:hypothetical protein
LLLPPPPPTLHLQIHNWATELSEKSGVPSLEFVAPAKVFVVVDGKKTFIDLSRVPVSSSS